MRRKTLIAIASAGALLIAALLFVRAWLVRDDTAPVAVSKVVQDYRGETSAAATTTLPAGVRIPDQGVYEYATTGGEQTRLLGTSKHDYPDPTTIAIRASDCGYTQTWTALDKRVEEWTFCKQPDGLQPRSFRDVHSFYGRDDDRTYECTGDGVFPLKPRDGEQTFTCKTDSTTRVDRIRVVGREPLTVDGTTVDTIHLRDRVTLSGSTATDTPGTADWWLDPETGLPIRIRVAIKDASDTPIGKKAQYEESFDLKLQSLKPQS
jgi:hypothetical protein